MKINKLALSLVALTLSISASALEATTTEIDGTTAPAAVKTSEAPANSIIGTDAQGRLTFKQGGGSCILGSIHQLEWTTNDNNNPSVFLTTNLRLANGDEVNASDYPEYVAKKTGGQSAFLPDLRGKFLRGADLGAGIDPNREIGVVQMDDIKSHKHDITIKLDPDGSPASNDNMANRGGNNNTKFVTTETKHTGGTETRPINYVTVYAVCVK